MTQRIRDYAAFLLLVGVVVFICWQIRFIAAQIDYPHWHNGPTTESTQ